MAASSSFSTASQAPHATATDEVESPSVSTTNALARFEFEAGHGREGTKILMIEWEDGDVAHGAQKGDWHISWEGKTTVLFANEHDEQQQQASGSSLSSSGTNRVYFLLPPGVTVPSIVTLTLRPKDATQAPLAVWNTNPLPAIFPPELGASARAAGNKGILHTIWAKKRMQCLQREIEAESRDNVEGIGFLMAVQEKEWIEQTFGVSTARPSGVPPAKSPSSLAPTPSSTSVEMGSLSGSAGAGGDGAAAAPPASPRSLGGGRLMEKLKGLKLSTLDSGGNASNAVDHEAGGGTMPPGNSASNNPLSPESSDIAVSSFAAFKGAANPAVPPAAPQQTPPRKLAAQAPPPAVLAQQQEQHQLGGMASLNAFTSGFASFQSRGPAPQAQQHLDEDDRDDGLFALPISPRSPDMVRSPFSFAGGEGAQKQQLERA